MEKSFILINYIQHYSGPSSVLLGLSFWDTFGIWTRSKYICWAHSNGSTLFVQEVKLRLVNEILLNFKPLLAFFYSTGLFSGIRLSAKLFLTPTHIYQQLFFRCHCCRDSKLNSYGSGGWLDQLRI